MKVCYAQKEKVPDEAKYLSKETYGGLCRRSLQYLKKWVTSYKLVTKGGEDDKKTENRGRRKKTRKRDNDSGHLNGHKLKPYSEQHVAWITGENERSEEWSKE